MGGRLGLTAPLDGLPISDSVELARIAEEAGYTDVWSAEVGGGDGLTVLAAIAAVTQKVRLGTAILPAFTRPPALLAMSAAALQSISRGRFVLGIGASTPAIVSGWMGIDFARPLTRIEETVRVLRDALSGKKVSFQGSSISVDKFRLTADPGSPVPIYVAALGPKMIQLAGQIADGLALYLFTPEGAKNAVDQFRNAAREAGRDPEQLGVVARIAVAVDEDRETLDYFLRRITASYVMVDAYRASLSRQGFENEANEIAGKWHSGDRDGAAAAVTPQMLEGLNVIGDAASCRSQLDEFRAAGIDTPIIFPASVEGDPAARLSKIKTILPQLID